MNKKNPHRPASYISPTVDVFCFKLEKAFATSGGNDDDNEHTEEEELF